MKTKVESIFWVVHCTCYKIISKGIMCIKKVVKHLLKDLPFRKCRLQQ